MTALNVTTQIGFEVERNYMSTNYFKLKAPLTLVNVHAEPVTFEPDVNTYFKVHLGYKDQKYVKVSVMGKDSEMYYQEMDRFFYNAVKVCLVQCKKPYYDKGVKQVSARRFYIVEATEPNYVYLSTDTGGVLRITVEEFYKHFKFI